MKKGKKRKFPWLICLLIVGFLAVALWRLVPESRKDGEEISESSGIEELLEDVTGILSGEPEEVRELRDKEIVLTDEEYQEYYFSQLSEAEMRVYREMLAGIQNRESEFYLTSSDDKQIDRAYHALLNDHPELFWIHNREHVYKTMYANSSYCKFSPGYTYSEAEIQEIQYAAEAAFQEVVSMIPQSADTYEKVKLVYTYLIDSVEYTASEHDQNIAGAFWKKGAVCAGYAAAVQYLLERLDIPCIYVEGNAKGSDEGHAWNIVQIGDQYYYVDVTNGDQPGFFEGSAAELAEHKTTMYDYLCPFPEEYEKAYNPLEDFSVPECRAVDKNFYVLNQGCFDTYDWQSLYDYCCMRLNNGAAVIRFKFSSQEAYDQAYAEWINGEEIQSAAMYYMELYGLQSVEYHYGVLEDMKTMYFMF